MGLGDHVGGVEDTTRHQTGLESFVPTNGIANIGLKLVQVFIGQVNAPFVA